MKSKHVWFVGSDIKTSILRPGRCTRREAVRDSIPYFENYDEALAESERLNVLAQRLTRPA